MDYTCYQNLKQQKALLYSTPFTFAASACAVSFKLGARSVKIKSKQTSLSDNQQTSGFNTVILWSIAEAIDHRCECFG